MEENQIDILVYHYENDKTIEERYPVITSSSNNGQMTDYPSTL